MEKSIGMSKEDLRDICFSLLREWWIAATQALVDEAGSENALTHLRPYFINTGVAGARNIQKILEVDEDELVRLGTPVFFYTLVTGGRRGRIFAADDGSLIWEFLDCGTGGICREGCLSLCEITPSAYWGELRHGSEAILQESLSLGDPSCLMLYTAKDQEHKVSAKHEFELRAEEHPFPPDDELNEYLALSVIGEAWSNATRAFVDFAGQERARDRLRFHMRHAGLSFGIRMSERFDARERGLQSILEIVDLVQLLHRRKGASSMTSGSVEGKVSECPFSSSTPEMCAQYEGFFSGVCESIDPSYEFVYDRMMTMGDKTCHWTIRKRGEPVKEQPKEEAPSGDLAKRLGQRFIDGEITEEEFDRKMAHLKKRGLVK